MQPSHIPPDGLVLFRETVERETRLMPSGERVTLSRTVRKTVQEVGESERHSGEGMDTGERRRAEDMRTAAALTGDGAGLLKRQERVQAALKAREAWVRVTGKEPSPRLEKSWLQLALDWPLERLVVAMNQTLSEHRDADADTFSTRFIHLLRRWRKEAETGVHHGPATGNPPQSSR